MDPRQVIIRPVVSEKSYALMADGKYTFRVHDRAHKTQIAQAVEEIFDVHVRSVRTAKVRAKPKRRGLHSGHSPLVEEGDRPARARASASSCSRARRWRARTWRSARQSRPAPGAASAPTSCARSSPATRPTKSLTEGKKRSERPQRGRPRHLAPPRRRGQAPLPADRLQAHQGRRARQGRDDRVRPQPQRLHRAAQLRRRREALHPRPAGPAGRRRGRLRRGRRHHARATRCR